MSNGRSLLFFFLKAQHCKEQAAQTQTQTQTQRERERERDLMESIEEEMVISAPVDPLGPASDGSEKNRLLSALLDLFKSALPGSDLTRFQVPVQMNMPKSQLQMFGESVYCFSDDLLAACTKGSSALQRFLHVVAWHISTTRLAPFGQAPFNPMIGETHHVSCGALNVFLEQVSHHPPISALYATNEIDDFRLQWWQNPCPRFYGNKVEVNVRGRRELFLDAHKEVYEMTCPKLVIQFLPTPCNQWVGESSIKCSVSQLEANLVFHARPFFSFWGATCQISGHVIDASTNTRLFDLSGSYNSVITKQDLITGETSVLFDAQTSLANLKAVEVQSKKNLEDTESVVVWRRAMAGLVRRDWDMARKAKHELEERQRASAKRRKREDTPWAPKHFRPAVQGGENWEWCHDGQPVKLAPLIVPWASQAPH